MIWCRRRTDPSAPVFRADVIGTLENGLIRRTDGTINYAPQPLQFVCSRAKLGWWHFQFAAPAIRRWLWPGGNQPPSSVSRHRSMVPSAQHTVTRSESAGPVDSYATVLRGRIRLIGRSRWKVRFRSGPRHCTLHPAATSGVNYQYAPDNPTEPHGRLAISRPRRPTEVLRLSLADRSHASAFGTPPDFKAEILVGCRLQGSALL